MLKKTLIAVAILAIVMPAFAADTKKFHEWQGHTVTTYDWATVSQINVCMDIGYWIEIDYDGKCIEVQQNGDLGPAFYTYSGCLEDVSVKTNFDATLKGTVAATSAAGGDWTATLDGNATWSSGGKGTYAVDICVVGLDVEIDKLDQSSDKVNVAVVTISVLPTNLV